MYPQITMRAMLNTRGVHELGDDFFSGDVLGRDRPCRAATGLVVGLDPVHGREDIVHRLEWKQRVARRPGRAVSGVLGNDGPASGQKASTPVAKPACSWTDILVPGHRELAPRRLNVLPVCLDVIRDLECARQLPAVIAKEAPCALINGDREFRTGQAVVAVDREN